MRVFAARPQHKAHPAVGTTTVRMVFDAKDQYPSQWAAIESIAVKIGCTGETLRTWVRQGQRDRGARPGTTTAELQRIKEQRLTRRFEAERPDQPQVADLTDVSTWPGIAYVAFVIDVFARDIVGTGDSDDNALAETINGLQKGRDHAPARALADPQGGRTGDAAAGLVVQPTTPAGAHRPHPAGRRRDH